jgi:hypothetical protein
MASGMHKEQREVRGFIGKGKTFKMFLQNQFLPFQGSIATDQLQMVTARYS